MIFAMVLSIFCCVNSQGVSAKVKNTVFIWEHVTYEVKPGSRELVRYRDEYKYKTAYTHVSICYWDKYLKSEAWMEIVICVDAVK